MQFIQFQIGLWSFNFYQNTAWMVKFLLNLLLTILFIYRIVNFSCLEMGIETGQEFHSHQFIDKEGRI